MTVDIRLITVFAIGLLLCPGPVVAQAQVERGVRVDGDLVLRVGPTGDISAESRADEIEARLASILERPTASLDPEVARSGVNRASRTITFAGTAVLTVTPEDAEANGTAIDRLAGDWAAAIQSALAKGRERRTSPGRAFTTQVRGSVRTAVARLLESLASFIPSALAALLVIAVFAGVAAGVRWVLSRRIPLLKEPMLQNLIRQIAFYSVWVAGILVAMDAAGFNPQTLVTGLGLTGVALGFALKDILSNLVSGVLIQTFRAFELGDEIVVGATEGSVERIELRATHIRTYDGRLVLVPNSEIFTSRVINNTASPVRRGSVDVHLTYTQDFACALEIACTAAQATRGVAANPHASTRIGALNASDVTLEVRFWTDSRRADFMATCAAVRMAVVTALREAGVHLPGPVAHEPVVQAPASDRPLSTAYPPAAAASSPPAAAPPRELRERPPS